MALLGNYSLVNKIPVKYFGGTTGDAQVRSNFNQSGRYRNRMYPDQTTTALPLYSVPTGSYPTLSWIIPQIAGSLASGNQIIGTSPTTANLAGGLNAAASLAGSGTVTNAAMLLIASLIASVSGTGNSTNANLLAILQASAGLIGDSSLSATRTAIAYLASDATGASTLTAVNYAIGELSANILSYGALTPQGISDAVWAQIIESGLTSAEILRIMASALAGKVSGAGTGVETFVGLNQVTNRITSTVDANGNRLSVVVDGT